MFISLRTNVRPLSKDDFDHAITKLIKLVKLMYFSGDFNAPKEG